MFLYRSPSPKGAMCAVHAIGEDDGKRTQKCPFGEGFKLKKNLIYTLSK